MQFIARDHRNESVGWSVYGVLMMNPELVKICFLCSRLGSLICPRAKLNPEAVAQSGESPLACTCFPSDQTAAYGGCTYCIIWTGIFTVFPPITPFIILSQVTNSDSHLEARMSRYLLEGLYIMSSCTMRMPVRVIIVMATKQKQTTAQGYV